MIAPTNCNPDCDCAQRLVRCERAAPAKPISNLEWEIANGLTVISDAPDAPAAFDAVEARYHLLRDRLIHAFRTCELDCGMWSDNALRKLADIAIKTLEVA